MVLLSPWLDLKSTGGQIGKVWAGNLSVTNPMVSPLYGSLAGLPPTYVYSGSLDPLETSAFALQQKAVAVGAPMSFVFENLRNSRLGYSHPARFALLAADRPATRYRGLIASHAKADHAHDVPTVRCRIYDLGMSAVN